MEPRRCLYCAFFSGVFWEEYGFCVLHFRHVPINFLCPYYFDIDDFIYLLLELAFTEEEE